MLIDAFHQMFPQITAGQALLLFMLIFCRWLVLTIMIPFLGAQLLPAMIRVMLSLALSVLTFMVVVHSADLSQNMNAVIFGILFLKEVLLGFVLGFLASLIFYAYEIFGEVVDFFRAASMSKMLVPEVQHQASAMGLLWFQVALVVFLAAGFHRQVLSGIFLSFVEFPPLSLTPGIFHGTVFGNAGIILGSLFDIALRLSLPVLTVSLLIDLGFGLLNRVASQINAYFLSLPAKMIGGLIMIFFVLPFLIEDFPEHFHQISTFFERALLQH